MGNKYANPSYTPLLAEDLYLALQLPPISLVITSAGTEKRRLFRFS